MIVRNCLSLLQSLRRLEDIIDKEEKKAIKNGVHFDLNLFLLGLSLSNASPSLLDSHKRS